MAYFVSSPSIMEASKSYVDSDLASDESIDAILSSLYSAPQKIEQKAETYAKSSDDTFPERKTSANMGIKETKLSPNRSTNKENEVKKSVKAVKISKKATPKEFWTDEDDTSLQPMPKLEKMPKARPHLFWEGNRSFSVDTIPQVLSLKPRPEKRVKTRVSSPRASKSSGEQLPKQNIRSNDKQNFPSKRGYKERRSNLRKAVEDPPPSYGRPERIRSPIIKKSFHFDPPPSSPYKSPHTLTDSSDIGKLFRKATRFSSHKPYFDWDCISPSPSKRRGALSVRLFGSISPHKCKDDGEISREIESPKQTDSYLLSLQMNKRLQNESNTKTNSMESISLRNIVSKIDENLSCALCPFERRCKETDFEKESKISDEYTTTKFSISPQKAKKMTTQQIIESLTDAFSDLDSQHQQYLREEKQSRKRENESKVEKTSKTNAKEKSPKHMKEEESLSDIEGQFLTTSSEVESVLYRLEMAEAESFHRFYTDQKRDKRNDDEPYTNAKAPTNVVEASLKALGSKVQQKTNDIELRLAKASINYAYLCSQEAPEPELKLNSETQPSPIDDIPDTDSSFKDVIRCEIIEKLDWTICKLKHALQVDQKEREEKEVERLLQKEAQLLREKQRQDQEDAKLELMKQATQARQRVMGKSSLDEINDWTLEERELLLKNEMDRFDSHECEATETEELNYEANLAWIRPRIDPAPNGIGQSKVKVHTLQQINEKAPLEQLEWLQKNRAQKSEWLAITSNR